jgi:hypothetical protein
MTQPAILVSPAGYDNVDAVLQQLGGRLANTRQLQDTEADLLKDVAFLKQFRHLFLNCHAMFETADPDIVKAVSLFVQDGGTLYASDWASSIVEAAFNHLVAFKRPGGDVELVDAVVNNVHLVHMLSKSSISINFDMDGWHSIARLPRGAEAYLLARHRGPIALGFGAGLGRVVYTSFHHRAQAGRGLPFSPEEQEFLKWIVTLPTQHSHLVNVGRTLVNYRGGGAPTTVVGRIGATTQTIPLHLGSKKGVGVCTLSWELAGDLEMSLTYLRRAEVLKSSSSARPPITLTVRDPREGDSVKVGRRLLADAPDRTEETYTFVFGSALRRDLLGDPGWLALAVSRHIHTLLGENASVGSALEILNEKTLLEILGKILRGLGYTVSQWPNEAGREITVRSWENVSESPDIRIEVHITDLMTPDVEPSDSEVAPTEPSRELPIPEGSADGTERLLVHALFSQEDKVEVIQDKPRRAKSPQASTLWQVFASERLPLEPPGEVVSAETFAIARYLDIEVYRLDE